MLNSIVSERGRSFINSLLFKSAELDKDLDSYLELSLYDNSERLRASKVMCSIAFEHAESAKMLIAARNYTSATGLVRL